MALDFMQVTTTQKKLGVYEIAPEFLMGKSKDLMIRGEDFYAIWDEERGFWSTDEDDAIRLIDAETRKVADEEVAKRGPEVKVKPRYMRYSSSGMIDKFHKYCKSQMRENFHPLDEKLIFANTEVKKTDYASKKLDYDLSEGQTPAYDDLISTLYSPEERHKIEWAIGSIVQGDSKKIQKFIVLYGAPGTGKGTIIKILELLFQGYSKAFEAKVLGSSNASFPLEQFKTNPLVAYDHDGDLSKIDNNTRLNSLVSHEPMPVNEKFKATYTIAFKCMLFIGSNKPVKITDAKSGLIRRLIDVSPTGVTLSPERYEDDMEKIHFELGAIAYHCKQVYLENPKAYNDYVPTTMLGASNHLYNFIEEMEEEYEQADGVTLRIAWDQYQKWCDASRITYPLSRLAFREELKNYFSEYIDRGELPDGTKIRQYYSGFDMSLMRPIVEEKQKIKPWLMLDECDSIFDKLYCDCPAQYANAKETPKVAWANCTTILSDLDTHQLHYVKVPSEMIVIDFDLKDKEGNKSLELNVEAANKWPPTYAELSKGGQGIHLHYLYSGDVSKLSSFYGESIEVKVFTGGSSLRRRLTKCNELSIASINSGLPLKEEKHVVNQKQIQDEQHLRNLIQKCMNRETDLKHTKPIIDFIFKLFEEAYESGVTYDLTPMRTAIAQFAAGSSNNPQYCLRVVNMMKFRSKDALMDYNVDPDTPGATGPIAFYDIEITAPGETEEEEACFLVCWKIYKEPVVHKLYNPSPEFMEKLFVMNEAEIRWGGFNNRKYDNHMVYARAGGYTVPQLYSLSSKLIGYKAGKDRGRDMDPHFSVAYGISEFDLWEIASNKQSLKKWEIKMKKPHKEMPWPWDKPMPKSMWEELGKYCANDVLATEALYDYIYPEVQAHEMLAKLATVIGGVPCKLNDNGNAIVQNMLFGDDRHPQDQFNYRNLGEKTDDTMWCYKDFLAGDPKAHIKYGKPYFPGYTYIYSKEERRMVSLYRDEDGSELPKEKQSPKRKHKEVREGGYVWSQPGMYMAKIPGERIAQTEDVASMHPRSIIAENLFGKYTSRFADLVQLRIFIKHKDYESARKMFGGILAPFLQDEKSAKIVAHALKIAINKVYGMTSSPEDYFRCKDPRNVDNIVAKRGALFMIDLRHAVEEQGFTVIHIKTDSIKILNPTNEIIDFVRRMGDAYGYTFETEAIFDKICLVNDSVYVGHCTLDSPAESSSPGDWVFTGEEFKEPFVAKTLFTHKPLELEDLSIVKTSKDALYLDMNEGLPDVSLEEEELKKVKAILKVFPGEDTDKMERLMKSFYNKYGLYSEDITVWEDLKTELEETIAKGHDYVFIGKTGAFTPVKEGCGGGRLLVCKEGEYSYASDAKGYRFLETETIETLGKQEDINMNFFISMADAAKEHIERVTGGDFEMFVSNDVEPLPDFMNVPITDNEEIPF